MDSATDSSGNPVDMQETKKRINWKKLFFSMLSSITWMAIGVVLVPLIFQTQEIDSPSDFIKTEDLRLWNDNICIAGNYTLAKIANTNSMDPTLDEDSIVMVKHITDYSEIQVGDIVTYKDSEGTVVHRIVWIDSKGVVVKGDNNAYPDYIHISFSALESVIVGILY